MRALHASLGLGLVVAIAAAAAACAPSGGDAASGPPPARADGGDDADASDAASEPLLPIDGGPGGPFADFPAQPVVDAPDGGGPVAPADAPALFAAAGAGAGEPPCLVEPEPDSLVPSNWLRPRARWIAQPGQNLFELRFHSANEVNDLVVYTASTSWTMPAPLWKAIANSLDDEGRIDVTVRGGVYADGALTDVSPPSHVGTLKIAPVEATGTIVYWTTSSYGSLKGFRVGDEGVTTVLAPSQVKAQVSGQQVTCLGCHTSTPDGKYAALAVSGGQWGNTFASIEQGTVGDAPPWFGAGAQEVLSQGPIGIMSFSAAHWAAGDRVMIAARRDKTLAELAWFDLEATGTAEGQAWGTLARTGDPRHAAAPSFSHDGATIAYVSTNAKVDGRVGAGEMDIYTVPYADRQGGAATPLFGAADPAWAEYYPAFSADDALVAFDRIPDGANAYDAAEAEVLVSAPASQIAVRLAANEPPACTGKTSPGVTNSWPKWSPEVADAIPGAPGAGHHWLVFSSRRGEDGRPQLYMTAVVGRVADGGVGPVVYETHGAVYLWNQPANESNHTPAWETFDIPPPDVH